MNSNIPDDFENKLLSSFRVINGAQAALSTQQVSYGQKLWTRLTENEKQNHDVYLIIAQGIELLNDLKTENVNDLTFNRGFALIKGLASKPLRMVKTHKKIYNTISEENQIKTFTKQIFIDLNCILGSHLIVTKASFIAKGKFGIVLKVNKVKDRTLPLFSEYAIKIPITSEKSELILNERAFLINLHDSPKLSPEEKIDLPPKPIHVTYKPDSFFKKESIEGYLMKFYPLSLYAYLNQTPLTMPQKISIAKKLIYKMSLLSKADVFYTDIKAENIMVDPKGDLLRVDFSDFGDCYITTQERKELYTTTYLMKEDKKLINAALKEPNLPLQTYVNRHMSRSLALVFAELFSSKDIDLKSDYTFEELQNYLTNKTPFLTLKNENIELFRIIIEMLELKPISPQEAWSKLSNQYSS